MNKLEVLLGIRPYLYFIADSSFGMDKLPQLTEQALQGGALLVQLRAKNIHKPQIITTAKLLQQKVKQYRGLLIINDIPELVKKVGAAGVHLGQQDTSVPDAREILQDEAIIGATIHTYEEALSISLGKLDYIGLGAIFHSTTKEHANLMSFELMEQIIKYIRNKSNCAIFCIGGINYKNMDKLKKYYMDGSIDGIAIISAIANADNPAKMSAMILDKLNKWT